MNRPRLVLLGMAMILSGFVVVAIGTLSTPGGSASSGGFILIGPFPIVFGSGPNSGLLAEVGVVVTLVVAFLYVATFLAWRHGRRHEPEVVPESE